MTQSQSDTFTEARARYVMGKIFDDFNGVLFRGFSSPSAETIKSWRNDVQFVMEKDALYSFELQFYHSGKSWVLRYEVDKYGSIARDDDSGGLDFYNIAQGATVRIVLDYNRAKTVVTEYLYNKGWGSDGKFTGQNGTSDKSFSKDGFGVNRKLTGGF